MGRPKFETVKNNFPSPNLPIVLTSFIGREREIAEIIRLLASSRFVTLTGAAGCGKTRLALRVASEVNIQFADGVFWIDLTQLNNLRLVQKAVAKALNLTDQPGRRWVDGLLEALKAERALLVLDNCEHVLSACSQLVETLLQAPGIRVLATSREPLDVPGQMLYPVAPLMLPPAERVSLEVQDYDAVQLFVERAQAILPGFALTPKNASLVAKICRHLDGIPLAIELASACVNLLSVEQIADRLQFATHRELFDLLETGASRTHNAPTMRAAIDWSYDLLTPLEQLLLRRLSVFKDGCSLTAVETVCAGNEIERQQILKLLSSLVKKSLVQAQTLMGSEARYHLLETIRQYAQEKLIAAGEWQVIRDQHLQYFLSMTEETVPKLNGPYQQIWLNWLEGEYNNIRAALTWALEGDRQTGSQVEMGLRIAIAIYQFWTIRDDVQEGLMWTEQLLARADEHVSPVVRANALAYAAFLAGFRGNVQAQIAYGQQAAALAEAAGEAGKPALRWALAAQAYEARAVGDFQKEFELGEQVIQINRTLKDLYQLGLTLTIYSFSAMILGKYDAARAMLEEGIPLLRQVGNPYRIAMALNFYGDLARCEQNYPLAQTVYEESISLLRQLNAPRDLASVLQNLGHTCLHLDDTMRAQILFNESLHVQLAQRNTPGIAECLIGFASLAVRSDLPAAGARLLASAVTLGGERITSAWAATRMEYELSLASVQSQLTETAIQSEQAAGRLYSIEQAVSYAQKLPIKRASSSVIAEKSEDLTMREREVVALVAQGKSNGEIADQLVISKRTVEKHIDNIRSKLGLENRAQVMHWAIRTEMGNPIDLPSE